MKKLTLFFFALLAVCLAFQACDNSKTYAEMLEEEKDAIKAFIKDSSIVVISQSEFYAQDSTTDVSRNEYVQLASGVYMQIVDKGSTNPADTVVCFMRGEGSLRLTSVTVCSTMPGLPIVCVG